ncbi:MAG TPA: gamma-glutamylcyclotransferase family protein [Devosia sp.]|nr:gamma-glutamylcyclotransferase family protein [Devosia sp.]
MPALFVYGTLRDPDILSAVLGRPLNGGAIADAAAPGFHVVHYPGRNYPGLVRVAGKAAPGLVLLDLSAFQMDLLDAFEGDEYRPEAIPVMIGEELHQVLAYLPTISIPGDAAAWTLSAWQAEHKSRLLFSHRDTAAGLRAKLIAIRPV